MTIFKLITILINFLVDRLKASAEKFDKNANHSTAIINNLVAKRMEQMEAAGKARALANNISKALN